MKARINLRHQSSSLAPLSLLSTEGQEAFHQALQEHADSFQPTSPVEFVLVEDITSAFWRMRRAAYVQTVYQERHMRDQTSHSGLPTSVDAFADIADQAVMTQAGRYETRFQIMYQRAIRTLKLVRSMKLTYEPSPPARAPHRPPSQSRNRSRNPRNPLIPKRNRSIQPLGRRNSTKHLLPPPASPPASTSSATLPPDRRRFKSSPTPPER